MAIKIVKPQQPVEGPYTSTRYTAQAKQGKNNTFTWSVNYMHVGSVGGRKHYRWYVCVMCAF